MDDSGTKVESHAITGQYPPQGIQFPVYVSPDNTTRSLNRPFNFVHQLHCTGSLGLKDSSMLSVIPPVFSSSAGRQKSLFFFPTVRCCIALR